MIFRIRSSRLQIVFEFPMVNGMTIIAEDKGAMLAKDPTYR